MYKKSDWFEVGTICNHNSFSNLSKMALVFYVRRTVGQYLSTQTPYYPIYDVSMTYLA